LPRASRFAVVFILLAMGSSAAKFKIDVQHLPPGFHPRRFVANRVGFSAYIWRGAVDGPVVLVNGATHGDEYEGPTLLRRWAESWRPENLRGTVIFVPVLNEGAFYAGLRSNSADDVNLARAFPALRAAP